MQNTNVFIIFNTNNPVQCCRMAVDDGMSLSGEDYRTVRDKCGNGPYAGLLAAYPWTLFRIRGPYFGWQKSGEIQLLQEKKYYIVDRLRVKVDEEWRDMINSVLSRFPELSKNQGDDVDENA